MNDGLLDGIILEIYLLTFCPPGPDDLLNEISQTRLGIMAKSNVESHSLANFSSFSEGSSTLLVLIPLLDSSLNRLFTIEAVNCRSGSLYRHCNITFCAS